MLDFQQVRLGLNSELLTGLSGASGVHRPQSRPLVDNSQGQLLSQGCIVCDGAGSASVDRDDCESMITKSYFMVSH